MVTVGESVDIGGERRGAGRGIASLGATLMEVAAEVPQREGRTNVANGAWVRARLVPRGGG